jgi:hypothetical protein
MFGLISSNGPNSNPSMWHALRPQGDGWTTLCTAATARPGLKVIAASPEPGPVTCRLARCQRAVEQWRNEASEASRAP